MWQACEALLGHFWQLIWSHIQLAPLANVWHVYSSFIVILVLFPAKGILKLASQYLYQPKETSGLLQYQKELEGVSPPFQCQQEPKMSRPLFQCIDQPEEISPVLRYLQHPEEFTDFHQELLQPEATVDLIDQQSEELSPVLQYLQQLEELGSNLLQRESCLLSSCPRNASKVENVTQVPMDMAFPTPAATYDETIMANAPAEMPGYGNEEQVTSSMIGVQSNNRRPLSRSYSKTSQKHSNSLAENRGIMGRPPTMPQASPSTQHFQTRNLSKQNLRPKTPSALCIHSGSPKASSGKKESPDSNTFKGVGNHQFGRLTNSRQPANSSQEEMEDAFSDSYEQTSRQHRPLGTPLLGSSRKVLKGSREDVKDSGTISSAKESLAASGQDVKAEGKPLLEKNNLIPANIKAKYGTAMLEKLISEEQARRALCEAGLIQGQKRLSDWTFKPLENPMASSPYADYYELGYNLRSNIFQGGPLESKSLMKDSYTPDVIKRAVRDPKHWHGRKTDDLGRWFQKNALNLNLQKALEQKYGEKNKGGKS
ncbi:hypothetical protein JD844_028404 [Phrynosoma platyrhinos]|uniref:Testis expressed 33 n=1 Tax=Phrynosoma platyrhinos TaxID=52577 RepID=A0ABQ7SHW7_PHRPL|nr:hypothetical protein JD844_028404 [Phrynosoma platyrhinos]